MSKIHVLSDHLANQIAAGEVVERPASVVKELLENSLDASATRIEVQVEGSGARLVRVVDNGEGMDGDDVLLSVERHATSKLYEGSGLDTIRTLGFRGEALPSIGSVSQLILLSRPAGRETGTRAEIRYGRLHGVHEAGCAAGTIVEVRNLFGNVPVRKKFLKTPQTELYHIEEAVRNQALAHVQTTFVLQVEGRVVLDLPARKTLEERFFDVFRRRDWWLHIGDENVQGLGLQGFLLQPESATARGGRLRILVNGRPVQDNMVRHAVIEGLRGFLMKGQAPGGVLLLQIQPDQVDVNVHPAKQEIRFRNPQEVRRCIAEEVSSALRQYQDRLRSDVFTVPSSSPAAGKQDSARKKVLSDAPPTGKKPVASFALQPLQKAKEVTAEPRPEIQVAEPAPVFTSGRADPDMAMPPESIASTEEDMTGLTLIGQLFNLYLVCEKEDRLIVIDQHAAHERIIFEELRRNYLQRNIPRQNLMFPASVELSPDQAEVMAQKREVVALLGFQMEHFGDETWIIKSVPALISRIDAVELVLATLEGLETASTRELHGGIAPAVEALLSSLACKAAIKAGNSLEPRAMIELLATMQGTDYFSHCPHGRPVVKVFAKRKIEQWFKR